MAPGTQIGLDRQFERVHAHVVEVADRRRRERLVGEIRQRRAAPHAQRRSQKLRGARRLAVLQRPPPVLHPRAKDLGVEVGGPDRQAVPARHRLDARCAERLAQARDRELQPLERAWRRRLAPQFLDQSIRAQRLVRVDEEQRQNHALLPAAQGDRLPIAQDLEWTHHPELQIRHLASRGHHATKDRRSEHRNTRTSDQRRVNGANRTCRWLSWFGNG
jgi:hypothetical protein